jgi:hypothetical protein
MQHIQSESQTDTKSEMQICNGVTLITVHVVNNFL